MAHRRLIHADLVRYLRARYALDWHGIHGAAHWARVRRIGLLLAEKIGADAQVVERFAFTHDVCRLDDGHDRVHGPRAADLVEEIFEARLGIGREQAALLAFACRHHTHGGTEADRTVQTCWDADRLDLGRVGIRPEPRYLCTAAARDARLIEWAWERSRVGRRQRAAR